MFQPCDHKENGICPYSAKSKYDPEVGDYLWETHTYCGVMSGSIDTRAMKLDKCWLNMSKGQRSKHVKNVNNSVFPRRGYRYDKSVKGWVRI